MACRDEASMRRTLDNSKRFDGTYEKIDRLIASVRAKVKSIHFEC